MKIRYDRPCQKRAYREGFLSGYTGSHDTRKPGRNPRIWAKAKKEGQAGRILDEKAWKVV